MIIVDRRLLVVNGRLLPSTLQLSYLISLSEDIQHLTACENTSGARSPDQEVKPPRKLTSAPAALNRI